ncbi:hypothetical protein ACMFMF_008831 [Clarireedia jacksonii]
MLLARDKIFRLGAGAGGLLPQRKKLLRCDGSASRANSTNFRLLGMFENSSHSLANAWKGGCTEKQILHYTPIKEWTIHNSNICQFARRRSVFLKSIEDLDRWYEGRQSTSLFVFGVGTELGWNELFHMAASTGWICLSKAVEASVDTTAA